MAANNVEGFAAELKVSVETLLDQLQAAGVQKKAADDAISEADKERLLDALRKSHGGADTAPRKKITITKKQTSEIRQADGSGKSRTIQVEVRKKRVFVKRDEPDAGAAAPAAPPPPAISPEELARREAEAKRQQELLARQEEARQEKLRELEAQAAAAEKAAEAARRAQDAAPEATTAAEASPAEAPEEGVKKSKVRKVTAAEDAAVKAAEARRAVEDEVAAINKLMTAARTGKLAATAKAPEPAKPESTITLTKPAKKPGEESSDKPKDKKSEKSVKSSQLS
ncbi:MAG: IF-2-associated domain-containing protein, partial [Burkholderiaceae bacterium]